MIPGAATAGPLSGPPSVPNAGRGVPDAGAALGPQSEAERFWGRVERGEPDECWAWNGSRSTKGYGRFQVGKRRIYAHRFAYELLVGPIPEGLQLDHLCRVRHCVNPAHLEPVTNRENVLRGTGIAAERAQRTQCPKGHDDYMAYKGRRTCRVCRRYDGNQLRIERRRRARARDVEAEVAGPATPALCPRDTSASTPSRFWRVLVDDDVLWLLDPRKRITTIQVSGGAL